MTNAIVPGALEIRVQGELPDEVVLPGSVGPYWAPGLDELPSPFRLHLAQLSGFGWFPTRFTPVR
jgi:hypothetical protein